MTGGPSRREQSEQFSLKELMKLEDERLQEQNRERSAREQAAVREREEASRRRRDEAEAVERAAAAARERDRLAELEAVARREAMQRAVVEQSRLEVEVRARAEERELERKHELELYRLRTEAKKGQLGSLAPAALLGGGVMLLVALGTHFGVVRPATDRRERELETNVVAESTRADELVRDLTEQRHKNETLEKTVAALAQEIDQLKNRAPKAAPLPTHKSGSPPSVATTERPPPPEIKCLKGDPLCPTIHR